ncbi:MAG: hypothetical protein A3G80_11540 [Betaproteobacteria bacterium RIFCSPLOWO2_12_FULL_62_13b]|nr:MAG: hypothetical protein A3G80_11540 [Betaproteobacteria bacterium RIFCSPLOWO2_12_FULL_62_13b]
MPYPEHNLKRFFKYTSASTALKILEASTVRYSSPLLFNDPFDVQSGLHFDFDIQSLPDKILERIEHFVASDTKPTLPQDDPWGHAVALMWEKKATHGFPRERVRTMLRPALEWLRDQIALVQSQYQKAWWEDFLPRLRVFSVAEAKDTLLMWSHYAESHTGVVFSFRVLPEEDNLLCVAKPVVYCKAPPSLFTEAEWLDDIFGVNRLDSSALHFRYAYVKSEVWAYEREWRVWDLLPRRQTVLHSDYRLRDREVEAVYLGCKISAEHKDTLMSLVATKYPEEKLFQARKPVDEFALCFDAI